MKLPQSGLNINNPSWPLLQAQISYWGITTAAGDAAGITLIDSFCGVAGLQPSYAGLVVKMISGGSAGQVRAIDAHALATGTISVRLTEPWTDSTGAVLQIAAGTRFVILSSAATAEAFPVAIINDIFDIVNAQLVLSETGGTLTTDGTEQTVYVNTVPAGVFEPNVLQIDMTDLALGITVVVRTFARILPGGALIPEDEMTFVGPCPATHRLKKITLPPNRFGVEATLEQTVGGAGVDFDWAAFPKE